MTQCIELCAVTMKITLHQLSVVASHLLLIRFMMQILIANHDRSLDALLLYLSIHARNAIIRGCRRNWGRSGATGLNGYWPGLKAQKNEFENLACAISSVGLSFDKIASLKFPLTTGLLLELFWVRSCKFNSWASLSISIQGPEEKMESWGNFVSWNLDRKNR